MSSLRIVHSLILMAIPLALSSPSQAESDANKTTEPVQLEITWHDLPVDARPNDDQSAVRDPDAIHVLPMRKAPLKAHLLPDGRIVITHEPTLERFRDPEEQPR